VHVETDCPQVVFADSRLMIAPFRRHHHCCFLAAHVDPIAARTVAAARKRQKGTKGEERGPWRLPSGGCREVTYLASHLAKSVAKTYNRTIDQSSLCHYSYFRVDLVVSRGPKLVRDETSWIG